MSGCKGVSVMSRRYYYHYYDRHDRSLERNSNRNQSQWSTERERQSHGSTQCQRDRERSRGYQRQSYEDQPYKHEPSMESDKDSHRIQNASTNRERLQDDSFKTERPLALQESSGSGNQESLERDSYYYEQVSSEKEYRRRPRTTSRERKSHRSKNQHRHRSRSRSHSLHKESKKHRHLSRHLLHTTDSSASSRSRSHSNSRSKYSSRKSYSHRRKHHGHGDNDYEDKDYISSDDSTDRCRKPYRKYGPNSTIMIRGLAEHLTEGDIHQDILSCGLQAVDIRLIINRDFAFVEFGSVADAVTWMERRQGVLSKDEKCVGKLVYNNTSKFKTKYLGKNKSYSTDWRCVNCQGYNFRRREICCNCRERRPDDEDKSESYKESSFHPTCTLTVGNLDTLTVEEGVLEALKLRPGLSSIPMRCVRISKDKATNLSRGMCFVNLNNVSDAIRLYSELKHEPLKIDGRVASVAYCKTGAPASASTVAHQAVAAAHWSADRSTGSPYNQEKIEELAQHSATQYSKTPEEYSRYLEHYTNYYNKNQSKRADDTNTLCNSPVVGPKSTALLQVQEKVVLASGSDSDVFKISWSSGEPNNTENVSINGFQYDNASKQYYSPESGFYFDPNTQYFYDPKRQEYQQWDSSSQSYVDVAVSNSSISHTDINTQNTSEKLDKISEAKQITKDMEKWEKSLKHRKDSNYKASEHSEDNNSKQALPQGMRFTPNTSTNFVKADGIGSDGESKAGAEDQTLIDFVKLACLLCKRQFSNLVQLEKHIELSELHQLNLLALRPFKNSNTAQINLNYRDRAEERRRKFGLDKIEPKNKLKDLYRKTKQDHGIDTVNYEENPDNAGISSLNIGNKMLQKMGWSSGQGLGAKNQGTTDVIMTERRNGFVGLGSSNQKLLTETDGNKYLNAKKWTLARFQQLELLDQ